MWFDCFAARLPGKEYTPFSEICKQLKAEYGAEYLEESRIPSIKMMHQVNVANIAKEKGLPEKELQIRGLSIPVTEKTFCYTQGDFTPERDGLLYLAYEERTGYQSSNSNQLFLEVLIARGITQEDITGNTEHLQTYRKWGAYYWETYGGKAAGNIDQRKPVDTDK